MKNAMSSTFILCLWMKEHPNCIVSFDHSSSYFKYDSDLGYFLYCNPHNKKLNGWYRARGLDSTYEKYLNQIGGQFYV